MNTRTAKHIAWRPLECHRFESAWSIIAKFCRWNGARFAEFWSLVAVDRHRPLPASRHYLRSCSWLDRDKFATTFRLAPDAVRNAFTERYAPTPHLEVCLVDTRRVRFCPTCARRGFHSPLYDLHLLARCPIHGDALMDACPSCGDAISAEPARGANCDPYACRCGHVLWPRLRSPAFSTAEAQALQAAVDWLDRSSAAICSRISEFPIPEDDIGDPHSVIVSAAIRCIEEIDEHVPPYIARHKPTHKR